MRLVGKKSNKSTDDDASIRDDPRIRDAAIFNRIKRMVEEEACHQEWGSELGILHRLGHITKAEWDAGNEYEKVERSHRWWMNRDVDNIQPIHQKNIEQMLDHVKNKWHKARDLLRQMRYGVYVERAIDKLCLRNELLNYVERRNAVRGLAVLSVFFGFEKNKGGTR